eukprot:GHVP01006806.1.p2 GENE.GHVP01006806.1~~GHVP01006806.1.p2  ORF type:complete len:388 (-),score=76.31 GHVP01006806.1:1552-2673(-)
MEISLAAAKFTNDDAAPLLVNSTLLDDLHCHEDELVGQNAALKLAASRAASAMAKSGGKPATSAEKKRSAALAVAGATLGGPMAKINAARSVADYYGVLPRNVLGPAGVAVASLSLIGFVAYKTGKLDYWLGIENIEAIKTQLLADAVNYNGQQIVFGSNLEKAPHSPFKLGLPSTEGFGVKLKKFEDLSTSIEGKPIIILPRSQLATINDVPEPVKRSVDVWAQPGSIPGCVMTPCNYNGKEMEVIIFEDSQASKIGENLVQRAKSTMDGSAGKPFWSVIQAHACLKKSNPTQKRTTVFVVPKDVVEAKKYKEVALQACLLLRLQELGLTDDVVFTNHPESDLGSVLELVAPTTSEKDSDYTKALEEMSQSL